MVRKLKISESDSRRKRNVKEAKIAVNGRVSDLATQYDSRKSFGGKAKVVTDSDGTQILYSYNTPVVELEKGKKVKLLPAWNSSATTLRHVKEFLLQNGFEAGSKAQIAKLYSDMTESKKSKTRRKSLKEGAGAGYTINCKGLSDINITFAAPERFVSNDKEHIKGWLISVDGTCDIDKLTADSYMYGTEELEDVPCKINRVLVDWYSVPDDVNLMDAESVSEDELIEYVKEALYEIDDIKYNYGGGWSHVKYDGTIGEITEKNYDVVEMQITDKSIIHYIDEAVRGDNTYTYYQVIIDGFDVYDTFDSEDEAIAVATEIGSGDYADASITVDRVTEYIGYDGEIIGEPDSEQVFEYME